jgi:membrane dipeptidase
MPSGQPIPVFDGHNDTLLRIRAGRHQFLERNAGGCIDLPRAREGGLAGGFFAIYIPDVGADELLAREAPEVIGYTLSASEPSSHQNDGDHSTPPILELGRSQEVAMEMMASMFRVETQAPDQVKVATTAGEIEAAFERGKLAAVLALEGAECIDRDLNALEVFYRAGVRSVGIVHSRPNIFGYGVPFRFNHSPDTGPGLTGAGRNLVKACNDLRIMIDLSHLNEKGFWDVAEMSDAHMVATHSCAHAICPATRNLTDRQLQAIRDSQGLVGLNFHVGFIRPDGALVQETPLEALAHQIDYLVERLGIDGVGFGSDFEYAVVPRSLGDAAGLPKLLEVLRRRGYTQAELEKLAYRNWIRVLRDTWGA